MSTADSAILADLLEDLLRAFAEDDPARVPLASTVRYTENGQPLEIGDGLWGTLTRFAGDGGEEDERLGDYRIDFVDEATDQAVFFGATIENTTPGMLMLRFERSGREITGIEAVSVREEVVGDHGGTVTMFQPRLLIPFNPGGFSRPDPALISAMGQADGAERLTAVVDAYFNAIEDDDPDKLALADNCVVRHNGVIAAGNPDLEPLNPEVPDYRPFALSVYDQIATGFSRYTTRVNHRRHVIVDAARGLVLSVAVFDHAARVHEIEVPGIGTVPFPGYVAGEEELNIAALPGSKIFPNLQVPTSDLTAQLTRVEDGRITYLEAISRGAPYGLPTGW